MKEFLIIPDQSFFEILFKINVNLSLLDEIENNYGQFILIDKNHENLLKIIIFLNENLEDTKDIIKFLDKMNNFIINNTIETFCFS